MIRVKRGVDIPIISYIDLIDWSDIVIDHKMKARRFSDGELAKDLQSSFYGLVLGRDKLEFHYHAALSLKKPEIKIIPLQRTRDDMNWVGRLVVSAWKQIESGLFSPSIQGWWCGKDYCSYWGYCRMPSNF